MHQAVPSFLLPRLVQPFWPLVFNYSVFSLSEHERTCIEKDIDDKTYKNETHKASQCHHVLFSNGSSCPRTLGIKTVHNNRTLGIVFCFLCAIGSCLIIPSPLLILLGIKSPHKAGIVTCHPRGCNKQCHHQEGLQNYKRSRRYTGL